MKKYEWLEACLKGREDGVPFKDLAKIHGTTTGTISAALWRHRNGYRDYGDRWKTFAERRLIKILEERKQAVGAILSSPMKIKPAHVKLLEAWACGCTNELCAIEAGRSRAWANTILRSYGLDTSIRFRSETLKRVQQAKEQK
jgi:hypothetical protein